MQLHTYLTVLSFFACLYTTTAAEFRIVGGSSTTISQTPYMVALRKYNRNYCAGSLISSRHVLTAAHCLYDTRAAVIIIIGNVSDLRQRGQRRRVQRMWYPRAFNYNTKTMDVGVIKMRRAMVTGPNLQPLPLCSTPLRVGMQMRVSGWGKINEGRTTGENVLRSVSVPIVSKQFCSNSYSRLGMRITPTMTCAGRGARDACSGDSGAPGVINGQVCTIVSFGKGCASREYPGVYTKVNNLRVKSFINRCLTL